MAQLRTSFWSNLLRKKTLNQDTTKSDLRKCLSLGDLTFLAIGSMVGSGLYVLTGTIARDIAGPSVVVSYIIAALASGLSAICYAEFGARVPVTGSAYQFTYLSIGEFWAFIIGWNVLIEHVVSASAVAKSWSGYLDAAMGDPVKNYLLQHCPMVGGGIIPAYPDLLAMGILILSTALIASGAHLSAKVTAGFAGLNIIIVAIIIGSGLYLGDIKNWTTVRGGFFPYGFSGTMSGAATLIFSYVGYEVIASTTEEALNPKRDVPLSLFIALSVVLIAYVGASSALTLMVPYYNISELSPFPEAFKIHGWAWARYLVTVGALTAMITTMVSSLYVVPRYLMAMARDGLLMQFFANVHKTTQVPVVSVIFAGVGCILFAIAFELRILVEFISIGQLLACTFVAICVIKLRYEPNSISRYMAMNEIEKANTEAPELLGDTRSRTPTERTLLSEDFRTSDITINETRTILPSSANGTLSPIPASETDTPLSTTSNSLEENAYMTREYIVGNVKTEILSSRWGHMFYWITKYEAGVIPYWLIIIATFSVTVVSVLVLFSHELIFSWWCIMLITIFSLLSLISIILLLAFNQDQSIESFKVPGVPFIPFISAIINIVLILKLQPMTWVRLGIWIAVGLIIYFGYGYRHSVARKEE